MKKDNLGVFFDSDFFLSDFYFTAVLVVVFSLLVFAFVLDWWERRDKR